MCNSIDHDITWDPVPYCEPQAFWWMCGQEGNRDGKLLLNLICYFSALALQWCPLNLFLCFEASNSKMQHLFVWWWRKTRNCTFRLWHWGRYISYMYQIFLFCFNTTIKCTHFKQEYYNSGIKATDWGHILFYPASSKALIRRCPDCPVLLPLHDPQGLESVKAATEKFNQESNQTSYFKLLEVGRLSTQVGAVCLEEIKVWYNMYE